MDSLLHFEYFAFLKLKFLTIMVGNNVWKLQVSTMKIEPVERMWSISNDDKALS